MVINVKSLIIFVHLNNLDTAEMREMKLMPIVMHLISLWASSDLHLKLI